MNANVSFVRLISYLLALILLFFSIILMVFYPEKFNPDFDSYLQIYGLSIRDAPSQTSNTMRYIFSYFQFLPSYKIIRSLLAISQLVLYFYIMPKSAFNEPMDAIVYGVVVSLGFATFENISYVYLGGFETDSFSLAIMRAVSAIPMHATCGIIMGYFFGLYAFTNSKNFLIKSLIFPIAIHATYNFLTLYDFFFLYFLVIVMIYARGLHTEFAELQLYKQKEDEDTQI